jgi:hypothetical protein
MLVQFSQARFSIGFLHLRAAATCGVCGTFRARPDDFDFATAAPTAVKLPLGHGQWSPILVDVISDAYEGLQVHTIATGVAEMR